MAGSFEKTFFLPGLVIPKVVSVVGEKTDKGISRVGPFFNGIEDVSDAIVDLRDLTVVACLEDACMRFVD